MQDAGPLNRFLAQIEQRAYRIARFGVRDADAALDIVQDAMLTLATKYADKPEREWPPLFYRILRNAIIDHHGRRKIRAAIFLPWQSRNGTELPAPGDLAADGEHAEPEFRARLAGASQRLETALAALPPRQREAFLLRAWEGLDVADTARAMQCSTGSVKTHYFRAVHSLRDSLGDDWP
jgi:RNA polymerase sigma-70 factor, ECF subfamily